MLVVGKFNGGQYLDQFPECAGPGARCIDPPPQLLDLEIRQSVYGATGPDRISIFTTNHFGLELLDFDSSHWSLILLRRSGQKYVMPRYANIEVLDGSGADPIIPVTYPNPIWWLPCAVDDLKVPVDFSSFGDVARLDSTDQLVEENPELFLAIGNSAIPRFGIRLSSIAVYMNKTQPSLTEFECRSEMPAQATMPDEGRHE